MKYRNAFIATAALFLTSCIEVEDYADSWKTGFADPCISAIVATDYFDQKPVNIDAVLTNVRFGDARFMLTKARPEDKGGSMIRYAIEDGQFVTYGLNETKREAFLKEFPASGVKLSDTTATIPRLNEKMQKLVETIAARADYWEETDRKPYNPTGNLACKLK